jgi:hypothetical protein
VHRASCGRQGTVQRCQSLRRAPDRRTTGLLPDPYFSATKIEWLIARTVCSSYRATSWRRTIDSWLVWQLTGGAVHATDPTNACACALRHQSPRGARVCSCLVFRWICCRTSPVERRLRCVNTAISASIQLELRATSRPRCSGKAASLGGWGRIHTGRVRLP